MNVELQKVNFQPLSLDSDLLKFKFDVLKLQS